MSTRGVLEDTDMLSREDVGRIYQRGAERLGGFEISASNREAEASAARSAGTGAFDMGSTVLGGAQQDADLRDRMPLNGCGAPGDY